MNVKFFEVLLAAAVALTATDWGFKGFQDKALSNTYYSPDELLTGQAGSTNSFGRNSSGNDSNSFLTFKEEQNILNTIIHLEESQRSPGRLLVNQNYFAYPLFSQSSGETNDVHQDVNRSSRPQELSFDAQDGGSTVESTLSSTWPPSPSSPIDDGELFGAVGYAPLSDNQYFDIESFLNADFPSDFNTDNEIGSLFGSTSITRQTSISSEQSESLDQLAQFLSASIESPNSPQFSPKRGPKFPIQFRSEEYAEGGISEVHQPTKHIKGTSTKDGTAKINEMKTLLKDDEDVASKPKGKVNAIAEIQSYDHVQKPSVVLKKRVKNEPVSPSSESDCSALSHSSDFEYNGDASSSSSSFDLLQKDEGKKQKFTEDQNQQIWLDLPYTKFDMINTKIEEFNDIITQLEPLRQHVAKEIRRKGKNKLAARNCRKRKMDAIDNLDVGVSELEKQKQLLLDERLQLELEREEIVRKTEYLYEHIFKNLRDERGLPYSKDNFVLTYTADGAVYLVPTTNQNSESIKSR